MRTSLLLASLALPLVGCTDDPGTPVLEADLGTDTRTWTPLIADFPENQLADIAFVSEVRSITLAGGDSVAGLYQYGNNIADDLFMSAWTTVTGLDDSMTKFDVEVTFASTVEGGCDVGGGTNVLLKVGLLAEEPTTVVDQLGWVRTAFDHGQQSVAVPTFPILGDIKNELSGCNGSEAWGLRTVRTPSPITISPVNGELKLFLATESAFEGDHQILFRRVTLSLAD